MYKKLQSSLAFTIVELLIVVSVIAVLASIVTLTATTIQKSTRDTARDAQVNIIASSLEKYYRDNGEYPSVAAMTNSNVNTVKQKLGISSPGVFKLPLAGTGVTNSIATSSPSTSTVVYSANTTDPTKNTQCQTDVNGYCDGFIMAYVKEVGGATKTIQSTHATFDAIKVDCDAGDTQSGNTCTHTYAGTYQAGAYTCPSGGTLSGTTCTRTYGATYVPAGGYYYCDNGYSASGITCSKSYSAPVQQWIEGDYSCPNGGSYTSNGPMSDPNICTISSTSTATYSCPHAADNLSGQSCTHMRSSYTTPTTCSNAGYIWTGGTYGFCYNSHAADFAGYTYSCPGGFSPFGVGTCYQSATQGPGHYYYDCGSQIPGHTLSRSGSTCTDSYTAAYATYSAYYYCSGAGTLSGSTCTEIYTGTQGAGYYTCPSGGIASGSTCSYTYQLQT